MAKDWKGGSASTFKTIEVTANATYMMKLPCVYSCHKENGELVYLLYDWDEDGNYIKAHIGDWLGEDEEGKWHVLDKPAREQKGNSYGKEVL